MNVQAALRLGSRLLEEASVPVPRFTAELLLCHALGRERPYLYAHPEQELDQKARSDFDRSLDERRRGTPTQYITGHQEFFGREFLVTPDVLIPRPETEHVVETALQLAPRAESILDVGCGSGAIAVTLSLELRRRVWASDISPAALLVARENARRLNAKVEFLAADATRALAPASLDLLVSNPPYIPDGETGLPSEVRDFEPPRALFAGPDGLAVYRKLTGDAARVLRPGGWLVLELGFKQTGHVRRMLERDWPCVRVTQDLAGFDRVLAARRT